MIMARSCGVRKVGVADNVRTSTSLAAWESTANKNVVIHFVHMAPSGGLDSQCVIYSRTSRTGFISIYIIGCD